MAVAPTSRSDPQRIGSTRQTVSEQTAMDPLMTIEEVAEYLRVSVLTVRWLRQEGRFCTAVKIGRRLSWERSALVAWVNAQREAAK